MLLLKELLLLIDCSDPRNELLLLIDWIDRFDPIRGMINRLIEPIRSDPIRGIKQLLLLFVLPLLRNSQFIRFFNKEGAIVKTIGRDKRQLINQCCCK